MSVTSKSPLDVLVTAWAVAKRALPAYRHVKSPNKFTQHQLFACLVLKNFSGSITAVSPSNFSTVRRYLKRSSWTTFPTTRRCKRQPSDCSHVRRRSRCWTRRWRCRWGVANACRMRRSIRPGSKQRVPVPSSCGDETPRKACGKSSFTGGPPSSA